MNLLLKKHSIKILFLFLIAIPLLMSSVDIFSGSMPFWFDPARDFLQALGNQHKITLIGQPTGIPGLFYGPYWIWLLSIALLISKDPRVVQFLVLSLPYFTIFPFILYKLSKIFDLKISMVLWILFISSYIRYTVFPWNPHLAPLLVLAIFYLLITRPGSSTKLFYLKTFTSGVLAGLVGNFNISFDVGLMIGIFIFFLLEFLRKVKVKNFIFLILQGFVFSTGFILTFAPFLLFEARHGFIQIKTVISTLLSPYAVVGLKGLTHDQIIQRALQVPSELLSLPKTLTVILIGLSIISLVYAVVRKKITLSKTEKSLLTLCLSVLASILFVFLTSKNPVWEYHFIAVEVIFIFLIGLFMKKSFMARTALIVWSIVVFTASIYLFFFIPKPDIMSYDTLAKKEYVVKTIDKDATGKTYTVFTYNPGIYSYEYSYLFKWLANKDVSYDPGNIQIGGDLVYLVIQKTNPAIFKDYVDYHTPKDSYTTTREWKIADGTVIIKRERNK